MPRPTLFEQIDLKDLSDRFIEFEDSDLPWLRALGVVPSNTGVLYHGTIHRTLEQIRSGSDEIVPVYTDQDVSLGGTYMARDYDIAEAMGRIAAREKGEKEFVVLTVRPIYDLYPDEDWVAAWYRRDFPREQYRAFFDDLFKGYHGTQDVPDADNSLPEHYRRRYDELNVQHGITWQDAIVWSGNVRQVEPLAIEQIVRIVDVIPRRELFLR